MKLSGYPGLKKAIKNNKLVIFAGAGLSYKLKNTQNETLQGWDNLVKKMLEYLEGEGYSVSNLKPLVDEFPPIEILNLLEFKKISKRETVPFVRIFFDLHDENNLVLHKKLFQLSSKIITTNYDTAFEDANPELRKYRAYKTKDYELTFVNEPQEPLLFKLHGCCEDGGSMVLFKSDYDNLYKNNERDSKHVLTRLRNVILDKTVLFMGCGMGDYQINHLFSEIKEIQGGYNQQHFIITNKELDSSLDFITPIKIKDYKELEQVIDDLIKEKKLQESIKTPEQELQEKQLKESEEKIKESEEKLKNTTTELERKNELLKRESFKYLFKGLSFFTKNEYEKAIEQYKLSIELFDRNDSAFNNWGSTLSTMAKLTKDVELYKQSIKKYSLSININPIGDTAYYNWGNSLFELGKLTKDKRFYEDSFIKYERALEINSQLDSVYLNWGVAYVKLAELTGDEKLFKKSIEKYAKSVEINPGKSSAYNNWGSALYKLGELNHDKKLYEESIKKYSKAIELNSEYDLAYNNWALSLRKLGKLTDDESLFKESFEKYAKVTELNLKDASAYYNGGTAILEYIELTKKMSFLEEAIEKFKKAYSLGGKSYNLACANALKGDKENAIKYLEKAIKNKEEDIDFIKNDPNWKDYLEDKDFKKLSAKYEKY